MLKVDLHTHTIVSGHAMNTANEMIQAAQEKGLELMAITDHGPKTVGGPIDFYFSIALQFPRYFNDLDVLIGCEANIMDMNGSLDLPERYLKRLDIVLAGLHKETGWVETSKEKNTKAIIEAMKNPYVDIISHPYNELYEVDVEKLVEASVEYNVPLEVNCLHLGYYGRNGIDIKDARDMIQFVRDKQWKLVISSDAHMTSMIGDDSILDRLNLRNIPQDVILNRSPDAVQKFLEEKRKNQLDRSPPLIRARSLTREPYMKRTYR